MAECDTFEDLAEAIIGRRFVASTGKDKNDYTRVDGKGEFYRVMSEKPKTDLRQKQQASSASLD